MKKFLFVIALLISGLGLNAQNVGDEAIVEYDGYSLKFTVTSVEPNECELVENNIPSSITSITIPSKVIMGENEYIVTKIGDSAFEQCWYLTSVMFEDDSQLTTIGEEAFCSCSRLTSIEIPRSVTSIGDYAFLKCTNIESIVVEEGNNVYDSRNNCNAIIETKWARLEFGCKNTVIPNTIQDISGSAFAYCSGLKNIEIPNSVERICYNAFYHCDSLISIKIPKSVTSIDGRAFESCSALSSIIVEEGNSDFDSRENCNAIIITEANSLIIGCKNTIIPNSVTSIEDYAFCGCSFLTSIEIPSSVNSIGMYAFEGCRNLTNIEIHNGVSWILRYAFYGCSCLRNIELPNTITLIGKGAFERTSLLSIRCLADSVPEMDSKVFQGCLSSMQIQVPENSIELYESAEQWSDFTITKIYPYHNGDYVIKEYDGYSLEFRANPLLEACEMVCESRPETQSKISIPSKVVINDVELDVVSMKNAAFSGCNNLIAVEIPKTVNSIGGYCFSGCYNLSNIICYADSVPETGDEIFYQCPSDMKIYVPENSMNDYMATAPWNEYTILSLNAAPENLTATAIDEYSIKLQWNDCLGHSYNIYSAETSLANVTGTSFVVENLRHYTDYCFTVTAVRNDTETDHSVEVCAKTHDLPITTPMNVAASAESTSEISLSWDSVENAQSYNVYLGDTLIANVTEASCQLDSLESYTEYCYTITSVRNESESEYSEEVCAKTHDLAISVPANIMAEATGSSMVSLSWEAVENAMSYNVYQGGELLTNVTEPTAIIEGLESYTEYCFVITAVRNDTETEASDEACVKTLDLQITTPLNVEASAISTSSIKLSWDIVDNAMSYNVYSGDTLVMNIDEEVCIIEGLEYDTEYCYTVTALRNEVETEKSKEVCEKTLGESIGELSASLSIYPNPANDEIVISSEVMIEEASVYDVYGRQLDKLTTGQQAGMKIDVSDLSKGVYFVKVKMSDAELVRSVIKL